MSSLAQEAAKARRAATHGRKYEPTLHVDRVDGRRETTARVRRTLHIRRKRAQRRLRNVVETS